MKPVEMRPDLKLEFEERVLAGKFTHICPLPSTLK